MIVYGDPSELRNLSDFRDAFEAAIERLRQSDGPALLDEFRSLLIEAGQLEQGAEDVPSGMEDALPVIRAITDACGAAFARHATEAAGAVLPEDLDRLARSVSRLKDVPDTRLKIKVPEGFAFYCLFPEQYCVAAERWSRDNAGRDSRRVAVVGIRSIGTSLSALVSARLQPLGWDVRRTTVRPTGHPFDRRATIDVDWLGRAELAIVVDEGPGASGSSMAAVAQALADAGLDRGAISFFPGHGNEPGAHASDWVCSWWAATPRYAVPMSELRWGGRTLTGILSESACKLLDGRPPVTQVEDLSGGLWRRFVYRDPSEWPAAFLPFERAKYRCTASNGHKVLWKFDGLTRATGRRDCDATVMGFVALPWIEGTPMRPEDADPEFIRDMGRYIAAMAGPALCSDELSSGHTRLSEMLYWNARELLGEDHADVARRCADVARVDLEAARFPRYGDGRLGPVEWIHSGRSRPQKVDRFGHDRDHTLIGRQPWLWDAAGAVVEWNLDDAAESLLIENSRLSANPARLRTFYRTAYAAFRAGLCNLCSQVCGDNADERQRLLRAQNFYADRLRRELSRSR